MCLPYLWSVSDGEVSHGQPCSRTFSRSCRKRAINKRAPAQLPASFELKHWPREVAAKVLLITDEKVEANDNREYPDWLDRER